jgi:hypothetical protein
MHKVIHYNPNLAHQIDHANAFKACGFDAVPTAYGQPADVHVISGNWFAYNAWKHHPRVLMIDRAWWGDPDCVSIGWLQSDGSRKFAQGSAPRPKPDMEQWKKREDSCLIVADYGQDVSDIAYRASRRFTTVNVRLHPADSTERRVVALEHAIRLHDVVIGHAGTAIFEAVIQGVPTICTDPLNECAPVCSSSVDEPLFRGDREQWLHDMSYKQFTLAEIADGTAWNLLKDIQ